MRFAVSLLSLVLLSDAAAQQILRITGTDAHVGTIGQDSFEPNVVKENLPLTNMRYVELHGGIAVIDLGAESKWPFPGLSGLVGFRAGVLHARFSLGQREACSDVVQRAGRAQ